MRVALENTQVFNGGNYAYQANGRQQSVLCHSAFVPFRVVALFRSPAVVPLVRVQRDSDFTMRGTVRKAEFVGRGHQLTFTLTVGEAQVK